MQIIIPMAGRGSRFQKAGYRDIKPLIEVDGKPIIEHVVALFPGATDFLFICAEDHLQNTPLEATLRRLVPRAQIKTIAPHKLGPVHSALGAESAIRDDVPVILSYCDYSAAWDFAKFQQFVKETGCDGCLPSYRGFHPHSLGPALYAYSRTEGDRVLEIREKKNFTDDKMKEFASCGMYYFSTGKQMKHYFKRAVAESLLVQGEYFASLPYNLMCKDGLDVRTFELERFLQWGTPEDLQEYLGWSSYFRGTHSAGPQSSHRPAKLPGTLLLPMAGLGERFKKQGYAQPKPLVRVDGEPMINRVIDSLPRMQNSVIVTNQTIAPLLDGVEARVVALNAPTGGAANTCLEAESMVVSDSPLLIAACDSAFVYNARKFAKIIADKNIDFVIWTFRNHPHANRNPNQYAWADTDDRGNVKRVSCKTALHENVTADAGVTGTFWIRHAGDFFESAKQLIASGERVGNEFYVDSVISGLAAKGRRGVPFDVEHFLCFGTPDDVRTYEYWATHFKKLATVQDVKSPRKRTA